MTFKEWLEIVKDKGLICDRYLPMVLSARSRKQYMDAVLNINGMAFLCDMRLMGHGLSNEAICDEFKSYINGRYIKTTYNEHGSYTSTMYCCVSRPSEVTVNTTLVGFFGCNCIVRVPKNTVCQIQLDNESTIELYVQPGAKCYVDVWRGGSLTWTGDGEVYIKHHDNRDA